MGTSGSLLRVPGVIALLFAQCPSAVGRPFILAKLFAPGHSFHCVFLSAESHSFYLKHKYKRTMSLKRINKVRYYVLGLNALLRWVAATLSRRFHTHSGGTHLRRNQTFDESMNESTISTNVDWNGSKSFLLLVIGAWEND